MTVAEAFNLIIERMYKKSSCGRLEKDERDAIRIVKRYLIEQGILS